MQEENKTQIFNTKLLRCTDSDIAEAGAILASGGLVAIPTETVYGLAANAFDENAVRSIYAAKGRPSDNPIIVHIARFEQLEALVSRIPEQALPLAERFWPGPLTMVMPKADTVPYVVTGGLDSVAVRMPLSEAARRIIDAADVPLAAPSANLSGKPSPTTLAHVIEDMDGRIPAILDGGNCGVGVESTVVSLCGDRPRLLRPGAVTAEDIASVCGCCDIDPAVLAALKQGEKASSPGMKYKHYAPKAKVIIVNGSLEQYAEYCRERRGDGVFALCFEGEGERLGMPYVEYGKDGDTLSQAKGLFSGLRRLDELGAATAYARCCEPEGVGLAVYNRLLRAAAFQVVSLAQTGKA